MQRRPHRISAIVAALILAGGTACAGAQSLSSDQFLSADSTTPNIYAPPAPPSPQQGENNGGVNVDVFFRYLTDDVYRGVSHDRASGGNIHAPNFQGQTQLSFDLGKWPHPFVGFFANIDDSDPVSRFQEVRPFFGLEYTLRPLIVALGQNTYIYPEREKLNPDPDTAEVYMRFTLDDSYFLLTRRPFLSPYIYGAYDYQRNKGWYLEAGLRHDLVFDEIGLTLTAYGDVAYVSNFAHQFVTVSPQDSGFQHYDVGVEATYSLNELLQIPARYGQFSLQGYLTYTSKFSNPVLANTLLWGGAGLVFKY